MARRRRQPRQRPASAYPAYLDHEAALFGAAGNAATEEYAGLDRLKLLRSPRAADAWVSLRSAAGTRYEDAGMRIVQFCLAHWPDQTKIEKGPSPSATLKRVRSAVAQLERALRQSPALDDLSTFDFLPPTMFNELLKPTRRRHVRETTIARLTRRSPEARIVLADAETKHEERWLEIIGLLGDEKATIAIKRFEKAANDRLHRRGDSRDPAEDFGLMLIDEMMYGADESGRRWLGKPVYGCAARLTEVVCGRGGMSAERLRKIRKRSGRTK